jgi:oxygen-dependent protoporphyrinogen oxidase
VFDVSSQSAGRRPTVVVVGGGVAGLSAAAALARDGRVSVTVLEGSPRVGGKLLRGEVAGVATDLGAESVLARRPEGLALIDTLGLSSQVVHPAVLSSAVWSRGALRSLPAGHVMGIPTRLRALASSGIVSPAGLARAALGVALPARSVEGDRSVADAIGSRLGREVVDRLVEPLLGGVYAGRADELSLRATLPQVAGRVGGRSLMSAMRSMSAPRPAAGPVFAGLPGGVGRIAEAAAADVAAHGGVVRVDSTVRSLERTTDGWRLVAGSAAAPTAVDADAVVIAVPAAPAGRLLSSVAPAAAAELTGIEYASMAIVTMAFKPSAFEKPLSGSGFLVPAVEGRLIKAVTFSSVKWGWYPADVVMLRCSIGRRGETSSLQRSDEELIAGALADLTVMAGMTGAPIDAVVTRWGGALPQYAVGHLDRVARIKAAVSAIDRLAVCGAAYDGLGIPACVGSGEAAATRVLRGVLQEGE